MLGDGQTEQMEKTLKPWKTLLVNLDDGLRAKNPEITIAIVGVSTILTFLIWMYQPPLLSSLSFLGIVFVIGEQVIPWCLKTVYGDSGEKMWNADKTIKYKKICQELAFYKNQILSVYEWFGKQKKESPGVYKNYEK